MTFYALSDLHLSFNKSVDLFQIDPELDITKPMDVFGWGHHYAKIRDHWIEKVQPQDTVLIPGDISWGLKLKEAIHDLQWIARLPGKKVLSPGNHCYYAHSKTKVREALPAGMTWIDADMVKVGHHVIAGTRGWILPGEPFFQPQTDQKIYQRQVGRLRMALASAHQQYPDLPKIVMLHFPPLSQHVQKSGFMDVMKEYEVQLCVYGHLHGEATKDAVQGQVDGVELRLVSCDSLHFQPLDLTPFLSPTPKQTDQ